MRYEWDEKKNRQNQRKHDGISFELASLVFEDPKVLVSPDRTDEAGEQRWHAIGSAQIWAEPAAVVLVVHAYREEVDGQEIIRIISARSAEKHELRRYKTQNLD